MARPLLSLVVLAYNDAQSLQILLPKLHGVLSSLSLFDFEIIVVSDGSIDRTSIVVSELAKKLSGIQLVAHEQNQGVGAAFCSGMRVARGDWVGYVDGDGQYDPQEIPKMLKEAPEYDAVISYRTRRCDPWHRKCLSQIYNALIRLIYGIKLRDVNSGLKVFSRVFLESTLPIESDSAFFDAEIMVKGIRCGGRVRELAILHLPRKFGSAGGINLKNLASAFSGVMNPKTWHRLRRWGGDSA